jgi:hypothetical protein
MLKLIAITAVLALSGGSAALAQDAATVDGFFARAESEVLGGARAVDQARGSLENLTTGDHMFDLEASKSYVVIGLCDNSCSDLDMAAVDPSGKNIGSDVADDDTPLIEVQATASGRYTFRVAMSACSAARCYYGVRVYEQ